MATRQPKAYLGLYIFLFLVSVYLVSVSTSFTSKNSGEGFMRISEVEMFLRTGDIGWNPRDKWGSPGRDGMRYNWHQFGQQVFALPFYLFLRGESYAYFFVNIAATALTAVMIMKTLFMIGFRARASGISALLFGVGTLSFFYAAKTPHEHALAIMFIMGGVYHTIRYQKGDGPKYLYLCMASIGFGLTVRYDVVLTLIPIAIYLYQGRKENAELKLPLLKAVLVSAALLAPFAGANLAYNYARFGSFLTTGYASSTGAPAKLFGLEFLPRGLIGAFFSPGKSIFLFSPVLVLVPFFVMQFRRKVQRRVFNLFMLICVIYVVFYCLHHSWDGDWCFGPRYFLVLNPFLLMALAPMFEDFKLKTMFKKALISTVLILSVLVQVAFVSSNTNLSNMMKFGVDDDSRPEISRRYTRSFGVHGSWEWLAGYFPLKYSQFLNQLRVFYYTFLISIDQANHRTVSDSILRSDSPYIVYYLGIMEKFDFWWLQSRAKVRSGFAFLPSAVAIAALTLAIRASGRKP